MALAGGPGGAVVHAAAAEGYAAPVLEFPPAGIGIVEAVRVALENDPDLKLKSAQASFQEGVAQEQSGKFDAALVGDLSGEYRRQELRESRKELEQEKRDTLDESISANQQAADDGNELLDALVAAQNSDPGDVTLPDPELNAQLLLIDTLILQATDPQQRQELEAVRNEFLTTYIDETVEAIRTAEENFQDMIATRQALGATPEEEEIYGGHLSISAPKQFRSGLELAPFFAGDAQGQNFVGKPHPADQGGMGIEDLFVFNLGLNAVYPLLRGSGAEAVAAGERASRLDHDASLALLRHQAAASVLRVVLAYWETRLAQELSDIAARSVALQAQLVELTQSLVAGGDVASSELARIQASQAQAQARLEDAERRSHEARVNLATAMGVTVTADPGTVPAARDTFPDPPLAPISDAEATALMSAALARRQDLAAAQKAEESGRVLVRAAEIDTRSRLDLEGGVWTTGLAERTAADAFDRWVGPSARLAVSWEKQLGGNDFYNGRLVQRRADLEQRSIDSADLARRVKLNIVRDARTLIDATERLRQARAAVGFYGLTIAAEIERYRAGDASLIDTILTEDQQTSALSELALARQDLARLLAQIRYETGSLVAHEADRNVVSREALVTLPAAGELGR
jgi:outer membrane protein TolC